VLSECRMQNAECRIQPKEWNQSDQKGQGRNVYCSSKNRAWSVKEAPPSISCGEHMSCSTLAPFRLRVRKFTAQQKFRSLRAVARRSKQAAPCFARGKEIDKSHSAAITRAEAAANRPRHSLQHSPKFRISHTMRWPAR